MRCDLTTPQTPAWINDLGGRFLVFDGPDGGGKSTQCKRFAQLAQSVGLSVCLVREPGGTAIGERIRQILLTPDHDEIDARCEMLLYMASRAQLVAEKIRPAIQAGRLVLADRFISSTLAYQGVAGGMDINEIRQVGEIVLKDCWPDQVVIFDVDEATASRRMVGYPIDARDGASPQPSLFADRVELKDQQFHRDVRQAYLDQATQHPNHYLVIDATLNATQVFDQLLNKLEAKLSHG